MMSYINLSKKRTGGKQIDKTRVIRNTAVCKYIVGK